MIAHREYDDEQTIATDFGPDVEVSVDVVGETAIAVAGKLQFEFDVPPEATAVTANDGMLLIKTWARRTTTSFSLLANGQL